MLTKELFLSGPYRLRSGSTCFVTWPVAKARHQTATDPTSCQKSRLHAKYTLSLKVFIRLFAIRLAVWAFQDGAVKLAGRR